MKILNNIDEGLYVIKNQGNTSHPFWDIALIRILQFDWLSGHARLCSQRILISTCRKLWCLPAPKKIVFTAQLASSYKFEGSCNLNGQEHFGP